jgi:SAM-dependent methyltransferase
VWLCNRIVTGGAQETWVLRSPVKSQRSSRARELDRRIVTTLDVRPLQEFYNSELGEVTRRLVGRVIRSRWANTSSLTIAALGYGLPYLDRFRDGASRCIALMPSQQGVVVWPDQRGCASTLVWADMLPLPDASVDRLLVAHALEAAERPETLLEEVWRVTAGEGRVIIVVPSRRGIWARADGTPFGQGSPYSRGQLRELLNRAILSPIFWGEALYFPPLPRNYIVRSAPAIERIGAALNLPFAGVHIVEAIKQIHRPVGARAVINRRLSPMRPALPPQPVPPSGLAPRGFGKKPLEAPRRSRQPVC